MRLNHRRVTLLCLSFFAFFFAFNTPFGGGQTPAAAQQKQPDPSKLNSAATEAQSEPSEEAATISESMLGALGFRSIGPALMSGRISDIAVDSVDPHIWYVAAGSGGIWKTVNSGTTWTPIFDNYGSYSIGCVTIDPLNHNTIWVGTGEAVGGRHVGFGDGVYVSRDSGKSFKNVGLEHSEHIAKILVDPRDSNTVYVAAQGPLWSSGGDRGLYKTTDGGQTWQQILAKGPWTGVTDIALDAQHPGTLYAATHQRQRTVAALLDGGPESGIFKSTDGGATWQGLTQGLPGEDKGKIAIAISPFDALTLYASIELADRKGGFYRSTDGGQSWSKMSDYTSGGTGPHYYQEIWADPHRDGSVYHANVVLGRTDDFGATFQGIGNENKHVDNHAVAFHPSDPQFLLVGCDGGLYKSFDRGQTFIFADNLPITQFYKVAVDYDWPVYHMVGGTQDNNTQYGPSRTLSENGIRNADWRITIGGDGHDCAVDPEDPNTLYCESQEGFLRRFDRATGQSVDIRPQPGAGEEGFRFNWDSPILISPHSHTRLYYGSKILHRSDDRGDSWKSVSGDLSRGLDRYKLPMMGRIWGLEAIWDLMAMSAYGNVTSISESPLVEGLIYVGTDDGLIQVTEDGGKNWRKIERIFDVPEFFFVNDIKADLHDKDTVYACVDNHKSGDFKPYVLMSRDRGKTWKNISGDLPERHLTWRLIQDHVRPNLLFLATEFGVFTSVDTGEHWIRMAGTPRIPFRDLEIQRRENDLVGASFGRSFYVLDDYSVLRDLPEVLKDKREFHIFPIRAGYWYIPDDRLGGRRGSQGDSYYSADNPPYGVTFAYYSANELKTQRQKRLDADAKLKAEGKDTPYPGWEAIKAEDRETEPALIFEIRDAKKRVVDRLKGSTGKGLSRATWNLRYAPLTANGMGTPLAPPGKYTVQAFRRQDNVTSPLGDPVGFEVVSVTESTLKPTPPDQILAFQQEVGELGQSVLAADSIIDESMEELKQVRNVISDGNHLDVAFLEEIQNLETQLLDARELIMGDRTATQRYAEGIPSVAQRVQSALFGTMGQTYGPTKTDRQQFQIAKKEYEEVIAKIRRVVETDMAKLRQKLDAAGVPWTRGRKIPPISK